MRSLPALLRPRAVALATALAALTLAGCGSVTGPSDAAPKRPTLAPKSAVADETPVDTTSNRPVIPWY